MQSSVLSDISVTEKDSWNKKLFLTFDQEWAHDEILADTLDLLDEGGIDSTWFVTHQSEILSRLRSDKKTELAIHPNFNFLLDGVRNGKEESAKEIICDIKNIVPEAKCARSHSLTQNELLIDSYLSMGITHLSNLFIPYVEGEIQKPFLLWDGITIVPHCWQDNVSLKMRTIFPADEILNNYFICLLFHPIHIFLNSENLERYERTRDFHHKPKELVRHRFEGYGIRNYLTDLIALSHK